jgi:hypothetical protein
MSAPGLGRVKTQRRANCREKYSFGSLLRGREEYIELRPLHVRSRFSVLRKISRFLTARVKRRPSGVADLGRFPPTTDIGRLPQYVRKGPRAALRFHDLQ